MVPAKVKNAASAFVERFTPAGRRSACQGILPWGLCGCDLVILTDRSVRYRQGGRMIHGTVLQTLASTTTPAGGAEIGQVIIATVGGLALSFGVLALVVGHRSGRLKIVGRAAALAERESGVAGWAALPGALLGIALITAS